MSTYEDRQDDAKEEVYYDYMQKKALRELDGDPQNWEPWMAEYLEESKNEKLQ